MSSSLVCKSFTLTGVDGSHVTLSETPEREEIVLSVVTYCSSGAQRATARLNAEQFETLCRMDSSYGGLEVRTTQLSVPSEEDEEA
jgi:hypothetical protein